MPMPPAMPSVQRRTAPSPQQARRVQPSQDISDEAPPAPVSAPPSIDEVVAQMQTGGSDAEAARKPQEIKYEGSHEKGGRNLSARCLQSRIVARRLAGLAHARALSGTILGCYAQGTVDEAAPSQVPFSPETKDRRVLGV